MATSNNGYCNNGYLCPLLNKKNLLHVSHLHVPFLSSTFLK